MEHQYYDLKTIDRGSVIEVTLGYAANVRIMDSSNYSNFKAGRQHKCIGEYVKSSSFRATVPHAAHWHVVVDLGGRTGRVSSSVRVLPS